MKKWHKISLGTLGALALVLIVSAIWLWPSLKILTGTEALDHATEAIPDAAGTTPAPLKKGEADWVRWRGAGEDGRSPVTGIIKDWSGGLKKLWEVNFLCQDNSTASWSAPVVQGNRLVVCGRDQERDLVFGLDPADGKLLWQAAYASKARTGHGSGPRATPCIEEDRVYTFGRSGDLACWNLLDGRELWRRNVRDEGGKEPGWGFSSSPLIAGPFVVVQGGGTARTIAYDKMTGEVAWKAGDNLAGYAALATMQLGGKPAILAFHGKGLAAVEAGSGRELWDVPWETPYDVNAMTPLLSDDLVFITSGYGTGCQLLRVSATGAEIVWQSKVVAAHHSDSYIIDGFLFGYSGQSSQNKGEFKCVELATGREQWSTGEMGWGTCVMVEGHLLCGDIKGNLFLMKPDPREFIKVTELRQALGEVEGPVWTVPVIANGRLYLRFKQRLVCYDLLKL